MSQEHQVELAVVGIIVWAFLCAVVGIWITERLEAKKLRRRVGVPPETETR